MRFDDRQIGPGYGVVLGGGVALGSEFSLRTMGTRFIGDDDYRAWRVKVGPQWSRTQRRSVGLFYVHDESNLFSATDGVVGQASTPVAERITARLGASYARGGDRSGGAVTVGGSWFGVSHLEIGGDVGIAHNAAFGIAGPGPSSGGLIDQVPIIGGGSPSQPPPEPLDEWGATATASLRLTFP
jgi:hypothetical protein